MDNEPNIDKEINVKRKKGQLEGRMATQLVVTGFVGGFLGILAYCGVDRAVNYYHPQFYNKIEENLNLKDPIINHSYLGLGIGAAAGLGLIYYKNSDKIKLY